MPNAQDLGRLGEGRASGGKARHRSQAAHPESEGAATRAAVPFPRQAQGHGQLGDLNPQRSQRTTSVRARSRMLRRVESRRASEMGRGTASPSVPLLSVFARRTSSSLMPTLFPDDIPPTWGGSKVKELTQILSRSSGSAVRSAWL
eukprot:Skav235407  [mRNA]  locus=scaffold487:202214:205126:- [translate_table: standard]